MNLKDLDFEGVLKQLPFAVAAISKDLEYLFANAEYMRLLGVESVKGKTVPDLLGEAFPKVESAIQKALSGQTTLYENLLRFAQRSVRVNATLVPLHSGSEVAGFLVVGREVEARLLKELERSKDRYEILYDSSPVGITIVNNKGLFECANPQMEKLLGYTEKELIGRSFLDITSQEDMKKSKNVFDGVQTGKGARIEIEKRYVHKQGHLVWCRTQATIVRDSEGTAQYILAILEDISKTKKAEEELEYSRGKLMRLSEKLMQVREEESKRVARELHDGLGQILTVLKINVLQLREANTIGERVLKGTQAVELVDRCISTIREISSRLRPAILDNLGLIEALSWEVKHFSEQTGVKCHFDSDSEVEVSEALGLAIYRLVQEALTNITRHAKAEEVNIHLEKDKGLLSLEISDDGIGMSALWRTKNDGLGLIGMEERVRQLGGTLQVTGRQGKGTSVKAMLPC